MNTTPATYSPTVGDFARIRYGNGTQLVYVVKVTKTGSAKVLRCFGRNSSHNPGGLGTWTVGSGSVKADQFLASADQEARDSDRQYVAALVCQEKVAAVFTGHGEGVRAKIDELAAGGNPVALRIQSLRK